MIRKYTRILLLLLILLSILIIWGLFALKNPKFFPIKNVVIKATYQHINPQDLQQIITPYTTSSFFALNVWGLKRALLQVPWIYAVTISRIWPDEVMVQVTEQQVVARWNDSALLNSDSKIFIPNKSTLPDDLPLLSGPNDRIEEVWQNYQSMNKSLTTLGLNISKIDLSATGNWHLLLNNGINVFLGNTDIMQRLHLFVTMYPKLIGINSDQVKNVDLRYNKGLAIKWKGNNKQYITGQN